MAALRCKYVRFHLVVLAIPLISFQVLFFYRLLHPSTPLVVVKLGDWKPLLTREEESSTTSTFDQDSNHPPKSRTKSHQEQQQPQEPSGTFNGYPIYYQSPDTPLLSQFHCIGETNAEPYFWRRKRQHVDMTWAYRSCHFQFLCLDLDHYEFHLYLDPQHHHYHQNDNQNIASHFESQQTIFSNQSADGHAYGVSMGGINAKWTHAAYPRLKWFPKIHFQAPSHFYALPSNVTLIPFHSLAAFNPGHLVWDDFLPIYTLLEIFGLQHDSELLLLRYQLPGDDGLWAGCDWKGARAKDCGSMLKKFGPLMVRRPEAIPITTQSTVRFTLHNNNNNNGNTPQSNLVCARHGLVGIGALTDHGIEKGHGWEEKDYKTVYNHGRGGQLWRFRNFLLDHLNLPTNTDPPQGPPYRIVFSEHSSDMGHRSLDFSEFVKALKATPAIASIVDIVQVQMKDLSLLQQAELVGQAAIYVTGCGGGAVTATLLPRGASLLVFYSEVGGVENSKSSGKPARLDWDYFNNMAYLRVHWVTQPKSRRRVLPQQLNLFTELVLHELDLIQRQREKQEDQPL